MTPARHRARRPRWRLPALAAALTAVVALVLAGWLLGIVPGSSHRLPAGTRTGSTDGVGTTAAASPPASTGAASTSPATPVATGTPLGTTAPGTSEPAVPAGDDTTEGPTATSAPGSSASPAASPGATPPLPLPLPSIPVVVLNETTRPGLAGLVAGQLTDSGWTVQHIGNFRGRVWQTTVYYPSGQQDAAAVLAAQLPGPGRTRPVFTGLSNRALTVILAADYPG